MSIKRTQFSLLVVLFIPKALSGASAILLQFCVRLFKRDLPKSHYRNNRANICTQTERSGESEREKERERIRDDITMDTKSTFECAGISSEKSLEAENGLSALLHYSFACLQLFMRFSPIQDSISFCHLKIYGLTSKISIVLVKTKTRNIMIYYHLIHFYN